MVEKQPVPAKLLPKLEAAGERALMAERDARNARTERDILIGEALRAGGSTRAVAAAVGLSPQQVDRIGRRYGWPTDEQRAAWALRAEENAHWRDPTWRDRALRELADLRAEREKRQLPPGGAD